jgi:cytochrome c oxidase cbb3-type subunit 3
MANVKKQGLLLSAIWIAVLTLISWVTANADDLADAKQNYQAFCAKCHGESGKGDGASAATLATKPRDFTDCARMAKESDEVVFKVIKEGGKANGFSADMQAWSQGFDDGEIHGLVAYLRTLCKK